MRYMNKRLGFLSFLLLISLAVGCDSSIDPVQLSHTVFFENPNSQYIQPIRVHHRQTILQPIDPTRTGYEFLGWYTDAQRVQIWDFSSPVTRNTRLYAGWSPVTYLITYIMGGGELPQSYPSVFTIESHDLHLPIPSKLGSGFEHWSDGERLITTIKSGSVGDRVLNAVWKSDGFSLFLVTEGEAYKQYPLENVPPNPFTMEGYSLEYWVDKTGKEYREGESLDGTSDLILFAHWKALAYTVSFNSNLPEGAALNPIEVTFGQSYGTLPVPSKEGHDFLGWYLQGTKINEHDVVDTARDHELEARYAAQIRTITFDSKEGSAVSQEEVEYGKPLREPIPPYRVGWTFLGWYTDDTYSEKWNFSQNVFNDFTLHARWEQLLIVQPKVDLGIWLDGLNGNRTEITIETNETITPTLFGSHAHLFEVTTRANPERTILSIRYKGEADPLSISEKRAFLALHSQIGVHTIELVAKPAIDEVWSLHMLLNTGLSLEEIYQRLRTRSYSEAIVGQGIISVLQFAQGSDSEQIAQRAYNTLKEQSLGNTPLINAFRGTAAAFLASKKGASGGSEIDAMQSYFQQIPNDSSHWIPLYWKGVTYLRTAQGIRDNWLAWTFGGYQKRVRELWEPEGRAALDKVKQHYLSHSLEEGAMDGFSYNRDFSPVPQEIIDDIKTLKNYNW